MKSIIKIKGFTLVELMVSLALGLLVVAAAIQLFLTGQISLSLQKSMTEVQNNANFGLNYIVTDIRKSNLDATNAVVNDQTLYGGIVFTSQKNRAKNTSGATPIIASPNIHKDISANLLTRSAATTETTLGLSNVAQKSDQLTIQFKPNRVGHDCEGGIITSADIAANTYIVQRYFLRPMDSLVGNTNLGLACDAGRYVPVANPETDANKTIVTGLGGNGEIIIRNVDYFYFLLGISDDETVEKMSYISVANYMKAQTYSAGKVTPRYRVKSIKIGLLVRSAESAGADQVITERNKTNFKVLDQDVILTTKNQYLREVITQTVAIRNGYGLRGTGDGL